jgi:hypothetical protein
MKFIMANSVIAIQAMKDSMRNAEENKTLFLPYLPSLPNPQCLPNLQ